MYSYGFNMKYAKSCSMKVQNVPQYLYFQKFYEKEERKPVKLNTAGAVITTESPCGIIVCWVS